MATSINIAYTQCTGEENSRTFPQRRTSPLTRFSWNIHSGDIGVLANCKSLSVFDTFKCRGITGKFPAHFLKGEPVR